jgi:hypothetical protein
VPITQPYTYSVLFLNPFDEIKFHLTHTKTNKYLLYHHHFYYCMYYCCCCYYYYCCCFCYCWCCCCRRRRCFCCYYYYYNYIVLDICIWLENIFIQIIIFFYLLYVRAHLTTSHPYEFFGHGSLPMFMIVCLYDICSSVIMLKTNTDLIHDNIQH